MRVLSLYDGISCGMAAFDRTGIPVESYNAFEIDKYAVQISEKNYPEIVHHGDVFDGDFTKFKGSDILIGGSPCTFWSVAKNNRETTPDGMGGKLFMEYVRALYESGAGYFLYENNYSIHKNIKDFISSELGVQPIMINSALVSAQQRKRCYWTNIPNVTQPDDRGILLKDILESGMPWQDKSFCMTASYDGAVFWNTVQRKQRTMVAMPIDTDSVMTVREATKKGYAEIKAGECVDLTMPNSKTRRGRRMAEKSNCLTTSCDYYEYLGRIEESPAPIRLGEYGNGGQGQRIYSVQGKSVTLSANGGGQGAKTGLYRIDLPDGDYIIRKLTPVEAERLQTLPDNYTEGISKTQRYKCIGNGWTVDVIAHILNGLKDR